MNRFSVECVISVLRAVGELDKAVEKFREEAWISGYRAGLEDRDDEEADEE
jgi:hypothetical protein